MSLLDSEQRWWVRSAVTKLNPPFTTHRLFNPKHLWLEVLFPSTPYELFGSLQHKSMVMFAWSYNERTLRASMVQKCKWILISAMFTDPEQTLGNEFFLASPMLIENQAFIVAFEEGR